MSCYEFEVELGGTKTTLGVKAPSRSLAHARMCEMLSDAFMDKAEFHPVVEVELVYDMATSAGEAKESALVR